MLMHPTNAAGDVVAMNPIRVALGLSMDASIISALAALVGATVGGLTSVLATWLAHRTQAHAQWLAHETIRRQDLYKEFIEEAASCYADALQHEKPEIPAWVELYAKIGRMRVVSSPRVVISAEHVGQKIIDTYLEPNKTFVELREMIDTKAIDILGDFSDACREEFRLLRTGQL